MKLLNTDPAVYTHEQPARATAAALQAGDSDWTYEAVERRQGGWVVAVRDETGALVGHWGQA